MFLGVKLFEEGTHVSVIEDDLKKTLEGLTQELFGDVEMRWNTDYFPFTGKRTKVAVVYFVLGSNTETNSCRSFVGTRNILQR